MPASGVVYSKGISDGQGTTPCMTPSTKSTANQKTIFVKIPNS